MKPLLQPFETIPSLNGIRAISVFLVVLAHSGFGYIIPGGLGVTIFFFLSGYLITTLMLVESERIGVIDIRNFYARRFFRLAPPLLITLTIAYSLNFCGILPGHITLEGLTAQLFYFSNYFSIFIDPHGDKTPSGTPVLWSLAIEEHFYIVFPLIMAFFVRSALRPRTIGIFLMCACFVVLMWRIHLVASPGFFVERTYNATDTRIDSIMYGCLTAVLFNPLRVSIRSQSMSFLQHALFLAGIAVLLFCLFYRNSVFRETIRYSLQGIALIPIFYFAILFNSNAMFRHLNSVWAVRIGNYSYTIYLSHLVIIFIVGKNIPSIANNPLIVFSVVLVASLAYAAAIDIWIDPYFRQLRRQYHRRSSQNRPPLHAKNWVSQTASGQLTCNEETAD
jgi:peptidoglycan/LPS O-acetylase OafA/YrhL